MANISGIYSVGDSLITFLRNKYPEPLRSEHACEFRLISSGELNETDGMGTAVILYLYRIEIDKHTRNTPHRQKTGATPLPLSLSLHYLFIIWADTPLAESKIAAWVMLQLHRYPVLDNSMLSGSGNWRHGDQISIVPMEMGNEDLMRLWDVLSPNYRLSLPYIARVVRIEADGVETGPPVVATRFRYGEVIDGHGKD